MIIKNSDFHFELEHNESPDGDAMAYNELIKRQICFFFSLLIIEKNLGTWRRIRLLGDLCSRSKKCDYQKLWDRTRTLTFKEVIITWWVYIIYKPQRKWRFLSKILLDCYQMQRSMKAITTREMVNVWHDDNGADRSAFRKRHPSLILLWKLNFEEWRRRWTDKGKTIWIFQDSVMWRMWYGAMSNLCWRQRPC